MSLYQSNKVIAKLTNFIMRGGKKALAMRIIDDAFITLRTKHNIEDPVSFTKMAVDHAKPIVETRKHYMGGRALHIPIPCTPKRQESLALRFIRDSFRARKEMSSSVKLANELVDLSKFSGGAYRKRDELHKRAELNRNFAHFLK